MYSAGLKRVPQSLYKDLCVVFQPVVRLANLQTIGYEALTRTTGTYPGITSLLKQATREGVLAEMETWICELALLEGRIFLEEGSLLFINMEVPSFSGFLGGKGEEVFRKAGGSVVLEITEHGILPNHRGMTEAARRWRELGVRLAVDDVIAGYDRLRHILRLEPEFIKLDRELVNNCHQEKRQKLMIHGLLEMGKALGAAVIAEGVETAEELNTLRKLGVEAGQGYLFSEPVSAAVILAGKGKREHKD